MTPSELVSRQRSDASDRTRLRTCVESASATPALAATLLSTLILVAAVFPVLPVGGELLDAKSGYTYEEAVAALESYGEQERGVYAWSSASACVVMAAALAVVSAARSALTGTSRS